MADTKSTSRNAWTRTARAGRSETGRPMAGEREQNRERETGWEEGRREKSERERVRERGEVE